MLNDLVIFKKSYDFSKWLLQHTNKFPKSHRFSVAVRLENSMLEFLRLISIANQRQQKLALLRSADEELLTLRILIRFSHDMKFIPVSSYEFAARQLDELGKMLGGWIKKSN
jgi:four helix bundle protein